LGENAPVKTTRRSTWIWAGLLLLFVLLFMWRALIPPAGQALKGNDIRGLFYPWLTLTREAIWSGRIPAWDTSQFGGYPFLSNPQVALFYPPTWLAILLPVNLGISWYVVLHIWLAGLGMFLFTRSMKAGWIGASLAALTFCFSGFVAARISAGHLGLLAALVWTPWLLLGAQWSIRRNDIWSAIVAGVPFGLSILAGHPTSVLFVGITWLALIVYLGLTEGRWLHVARQTALSGLAGLVLGAALLLPFLEFSIISTRAGGAPENYGYWSMPPAHLITFFVPNYFGDPTIGWWSVENFEELTYYVGILPLLGIPLALRKPNRLTWVYISLMIFGILMALGTYGFLYPLLYDLLLPFKLARAPGRAAFLFVFAASALLADSVTRWEEAPQESSPTRFINRTTIILGIAGITALAATGAIFASQHPSDTSGRLWHQLGGWGWALTMIVIGGILLSRYLAADPDQPARRRALGLGLIALVIADLWLFGFKLIQLEPAGAAPIWTDARQIIGETDERILPWGLADLFSHNHAAQVGYDSMFGYNTLQIQANQSFVDVVPDPRSTAYDIFGVGYVIAGGPIYEPFLEGEQGLQLIGNTDNVWVYRRARVMPVARIVYQAEVIPDRAAAAQRIHDPDFDPAQTAILAEQPPCELDGTSLGSAQVIGRQPGHWLIDVQTESPGLLVLGETAYPGWRVTVDGQHAESLTAYTVVKAVCVPAGSHQVEWKFDPLSYKLGFALSVIALGVVIFAAVQIWRQGQDRKVSQAEPVQEIDA
jgi:hypothetical protein